MAATTLTTMMTTVTTDKSNWKENKALVWIWKGIEFVAAQWLLIGFGVACVLGCFFPREFSLLRLLFLGIFCDAEFSFFSEWDLPSAIG